jgi:hypothetical protein
MDCFVTMPSGQGAYTGSPEEGLLLFDHSTTNALA